LKTSALFLTLGAIALQTCPPSVIIVYLVYTIHLTIQFYEVQNNSKDNVDGILVLVALANTFCYVGLVFISFYLAPFAFANVHLFYGLYVWGAITNVFITVASCYMTGLKKINFYVNAGYLAWILNTVVTFAYLYGRGEMDLVYRQIVVHGHFPVVFVVLPLLSLVAAYAFSAAGAVAYLQNVQLEEDRQDKQKRQEDKKKRDEKEKEKAVAALLPAAPSSKSSDSEDETKRPEAITNE